MPENRNIQMKMMSDEEQIMELRDRLSAQDQERMLRDVSEQERIEARAHELALRIALKMNGPGSDAVRLLEEAFAAREQELAREREKMREEKEAIAAQKQELDEEKEKVREEKESLATQKQELEVREAGLCMREDRVAAKEKWLQATVAEINESQAELARGIQRQNEEASKNDRAVYEQCKRELERSFDARIAKAMADLLEKTKGVFEATGKSAAEQSAAVAEFEKTASSIKAEASKELAKMASKMQARSASRQRHLRYCVRKIFGSTSEKVRDDDVMSLVDAVLDDPGLKITDEQRQKAKEAREFLTKYNCRRELEKYRKAEKDRKDEKEEKDEEGGGLKLITREYLESLPVYGNPIVLYPKEYEENPSRFVEITSESNRPRSYELVIVPEHAEARVIELPKFKEKDNPDSPVYQATLEGSRPFTKSYASPELEAKIEVEHFVDCDPLYTQEQRYARSGLKISRQWMDKIHVRACDLLEPLFDAHYYDVLGGEYFLGDGSTFRIPNHKTHGTDKHYMVNLISLDRRAGLFNVGSRIGEDGEILSHGRGAKDLAGLFEAMGNGKALEKDGCESWNSGLAAKGIIECNCNAHARREFEEAAAEDPLPSRIAQSFYTVLYGAERYISDQKLEGREKTAKRKELEQPVWSSFISWATMEKQRHPKGSAIYGALNYLLDHRKALMAYLKLPMMPIDNNECERGFKPLVKGRKTSYFFQDLLSAWRASMMYSFFESCSMNDVNPEKWLTYVLEHIKTTPEDRLVCLLPQHIDKRLLAF